MFLKLNFQDCYCYYLIVRYSLQSQQSNQGRANHQSLKFFLCWFVYSGCFYGGWLCSIERTNQMGYITAIAQVARDLWQCKQTLSSGFALGLSSFTAINPWHPCYNYYIAI